MEIPSRRSVEGILSGETEVRELVWPWCLAQVNDVILSAGRMDLELLMLHGDRARNKRPRFLHVFSLLFLLNRITSLPLGLRDGSKPITSVSKAIRNWHAAVTLTERATVQSDLPWYQACKLLATSCANSRLTSAPWSLRQSDHKRTWARYSWSTGNA